MKCDRCSNEATVHEVRIQGGKKVERHLCEQCAREEGLPVNPATPNVSALLQQFMAQQSAAAKSEIGAPPEMIADPARLQCPGCGTTYGQFRHSGLLGCPACYEAFEQPLSPLLQRAHEGGTCHAGKIPKRFACTAVPGGAAQGVKPVQAAASAATAAMSAAAGATDRQRRLEQLRQRLGAAIVAEQYEEAARIRDEIRRLEAEGAKA